jgi:ABC-type multidrug transport system ATPase subunit
MPGLVDGWADQNTYFSVAALVPTADGELRRRKTNFQRLLALVADDVHIEDIQGLVSWVLETSPGKTQVGILIDRDCPDASTIGLVDRLVTTMAERGLLKADTSGNNSVRYVRLPVGQNQKPRATGPWAHRMLRWAPAVVLTLDDAAAAFGVSLDDLRAEVKPATSDGSSGRQGEMLRMLTTNVVRGERLHESINEIAASFVATGMPGGAAVNVLRALMESSPAAKDDRWLARYSDIPRSVRTAEQKYRHDFSVPIPAAGEFRLRRAVVDFTTLKPIKWIICGFCAAGEVTVFAGQPGVGKTTVFASAALAIGGFGAQIGSTLVVDRPRRVVIVSEHPAQYERIFFGFIRRFELDADEVAKQIMLFDSSRVPVSEISRELEHLIDEGAAAGEEPPLIILDTASASFDVADENSNAEIGAMLAEVKRPITRTGATLWIISHAAKALGREDSEITPRGASAYIGDVHGTASVFRDKNFPGSVFIKSLKNRTEREFSEIEFRTEVVRHEVEDERHQWQRVGIRLSVPVAVQTGMRQEAAQESLQAQRVEDEVRKVQALDLRILHALGEALMAGTLIGRRALAEAAKAKKSTAFERIEALIALGEIVEFDVPYAKRPRNFKAGLRFPTTDEAALISRLPNLGSEPNIAVPELRFPLKENNNGNRIGGASPPHHAFPVPQSSGTAREPQGTTGTTTGGPHAQNL